MFSILEKHHLLYKAKSTLWYTISIMKIISWNVNGFRAWNKKDETLNFVKKEEADIFCIQETKAKEEQIDSSLLVNYPFVFINSAEKKGYSGIAIFSKTKPLSISYEMDDSPLTNEGRIINAEFETFILVTVYTPNSKTDLSRLDLRHKKWDKAFLKHIQKLEEKKPVIVCGDFNVAHSDIDIARPDANKTTKTKPGSPGFTDKEREGFENFIKAGFIDSFRQCYPDTVQYSWWSYRAFARERNVGWRIDYFLTSKTLKEKIKNAIIYDQVKGSDHCPIAIVFNI